MPLMKAILTVMAVALSTVNAHMIMTAPVPYGTPDSSPLVADGSNFPCKASSNTGATTNKMAIGAPQELAFKGSAVHGGGSCQVSLTKDTPATKSSKWMVIHSIEGGCPAKGVQGNLPEDPNGSGSSKYSFTIPAGVAPGAYTLAWTWFNKIGNREMYMNCASVQVTGASKKRDIHHPHQPSGNETFTIPELSERGTTFPDMFVANIPTTNCLTTDSKDLKFPDPGSSVEQDGSDTSANGLVPPTGPQCSAGPAAAGGGAGGSSASSGGSSGAGAGAGAGSGAGSGAGGAASPSAAAASSPATSGTSGSGAAAPSNTGSGAAPAGASSSPPAGAAPSGTGAALVSPAAPSSAPAASAPFANASAGVASSAAAPSAAGPPAAAAAAPSTSPSSSGAITPATGGSSTGSCTTAGASICSPDGKQIGTCTSGLTVTWIPVALGTECKNGMMVMAGSKMLKSRSARFLRWAF